MGIPDIRIPEILIKAGNIYKIMGYKKKDCSELISQLRRYKLNEAPFNVPYLHREDNPLKWWSTCFSSKNQLQNFAIQLFSISPHAASCERIWYSNLFTSLLN